MRDTDALLIDLLQDKRKRLFLFIGAALAVILIAVILITVLGGGGRKFNKYYNEAEQAYLDGDFDTAEEKLRRAMELKSNEKAYLLMAEIYCAEGDTDRAIQILYLGYSHVGGSTIEARLEELKSAQATAVTPMPQREVTIAGPTVDASVTSLVLTGTRLRDDDLYEIASLTRMESLGVSDCGLRDLSFLSGFTELTFLQISDNDVTSLLPITGMRHLKTLYIDNNPIEDLTPLYTLDALRTLSMKGIPVTQAQLDALREALPNCSVYADKPAVQVHELTLGGRKFTSDVTELKLGGLGIDDISVLRACSTLEKLDMRDNQISALSPLVELPNLKWLSLWNNQVEDLNPLLSLSRLEYLDVEGNRISDFSVLEYLPDLKELWLNGNPVKSFDPLRGLTKLERLGLAGTGLTDDDLDILTPMAGLTELNIKGNKGLTAGRFDALQAALPKCEISHDELLYAVRFGDKEFYSDATEIVAESLDVSDLSGLEEFQSLLRLELDGNRVTDLSPLRTLTKLRELSLSGSRVSDLSPLSGLKQLSRLDLSGNQVSDLTPLAGCGGLRTLSLRGNDLTDLTPLGYLTGLTTLDLADNRITDLSALYTLSALSSLDLRGNPLRYDDILALQTALPDCSVLHDTEPPEEG